MKDSDIDAQLRALYYDEASPAAYGGIQKLYRHAHQSGIKNVTLAKVRQFLSKQQSYTLHRPVRHRFLRNKTYVRGIDSQWQADLADMQSLARANGGYKYLLTCIDVFSKFAWVAPVKDKSGDSVAKAFSIVLSKAAPRVPEKLQTDKGKEFFNKAFQDIMHKHKIHHFASNSDMKAAVVERYNRTLKSRLWNYFTANKTTRYIDSLQTHVDAYNSTIHRTTGMAPRDVKPHDEPRLWKRMFMHNDDSNSMPRKSILARGKLVRLSKWKGAFDKGYIPNWTREHFRISKREGHPQADVYRIEDAAGEPVEGCFYRSEVQPIGRNDFEVEKVIKRRVVDGRTEHFVKWNGWSDAFNTWIDPQQTYSEND